MNTAFPIILVAGALATSIIGTPGPARAEYVKKSVTAQQRVEAQCNMAALNSMNGFDIWGDAIVAYGVKNTCMNAAGYVWKRPARPAKAKKSAGAGNRNSLANE
jgi:hypothetical protein